METNRPTDRMMFDLGRSYYQQRVENWSEQLPGQNAHRQVHQVGQEAIELIVANHTMETTGRDPEEVGKEATDVIIAALGVLGSLQLDFATLFEEVMDETERKYDPYQIAVYMANGQSLDQAMATAKTVYSASQNGHSVNGA